MLFLSPAEKVEEKVEFLPRQQSHNTIGSPVENVDKQGKQQGRAQLQAQMRAKEKQLKLKIELPLACLCDCYRKRHCCSAGDSLEPYKI